MRGAINGPSFCITCAGHKGIDLPKECPMRPMTLMEMANVADHKLYIEKGVWLWVQGVTHETMTRPVVH